MHHRPIFRFSPCLDRLEEKQLPSATSFGLHAAMPAVRSRALADHPVDQSGTRDIASHDTRKPSSLPSSFLAFRITNPSGTPVNLIPPFNQVLVQNLQPVPGHVYNVLYVAVKNGTAQTFTASRGFEVRLNNQAPSLTFPVLTGAQQWKPNQWIVFYVLTEKYYPVSPVSGGFELILGGGRSTLVPGPSGIFLRLKYDPATFARTLDWIVAFGPGAESGKGPKYGLPDTAIYEIVAASTHRNDFGGHF